MTLTLHDVAQAMGAAGSPPPGSASGWSVDTRTQNPGDVYFALRGPNHDGHDYVAAALAKGAVAAVVEQSQGGAAELVVPDSELALQTLGAWAREQWGGTVIGVTGSAGKTTTKDAIAHLLSAGLGAERVGKTIGNFNNHVGVPLSLLRLPDGCTTAVIEMGMNHGGELRRLTEIAKPQFGVVTNVGYAHVEFFEGIEGIALAKRELIGGLTPDGVAILNADDSRVAEFREVHAGRTVTFGLGETADVRGEDVEFGAEFTRFRALGVGFETTLTGRHSVMNLLAAIAVAREFGVAPERMVEAVRSFAVGKMRGERIDHNGIVIWNDCYNSNPEAAQSMLDVLRATSASRHVAVLGEMLELGHAADELHRQVGRYAAAAGVDLLIGIRGAASAMVEAASRQGTPAQFFENPADAGEFARNLAQPGDAFLFKGSRGVHVEQALERFTA